MIHIIIFSILVIGAFVYTFLKMIKENNTNYVYILGLEFLGIVIDFILILNGKIPNLIILSILYVITIIIPITMLIMEMKGIYIDELYNILKAKKQPDNAKELLLKNINKYPKSYISHKKLAQYYEQNSEMEKAEDEYLIVIGIKPKDYESYCELAKIMHENKKEEQAIELLQSLLKTKPDYYQGSMLLGDILYSNEMFKEAILVYNEALKFSPAQYELYYCLGMTYTRLNDFQNAQEYYKKAATLNSLKDISNLNLGQISMIFREYEEAEKYFYEEINSDDEKIQANAYLYLAKIKIIQKDTNQAVQYANLAIEIDPNLIRKVEKDFTLSIILGKLRIPESKKVKTKLKEKEENIIEYLGKTYNVVEKLADDIQKPGIERER